MGSFIVVLILITCFLLVAIVLIQNPKGGGLSAEFSSSNQFMGVRKTADFLGKATWGLAIILMSLSLISSFNKPGEGEETESVIQEKIEDLPDPIQNVPNLPEQIPTPTNK